MQPIQNHNSNQKMKDRNKLPQFIVDGIETNRTSLMKEPVICPDEQLLKLMNARFAAVCSNFNDNILAHAPTEVFNKLGRLIQICQAKERNIRPQLEKFCYNTIVELFDIPEDCITLSLSIDESISPDKSFQVSPKTGSNEEPYREYADIENDSKEIQKRRILNIMVTGAAMDLTNRGLKKILSEVFDLDEELPHLYSKILKINEYLNFVSNIKISDKNPQQAGYENVVNREYALIGVPFDHVGHLSAAVAQADHAGTGNVQKVDKAVFPALHGNVVNSVVFRVSRSFTVVRSENLFTELAVKRSASEKHHETDYECYHNVSLLVAGEFRRTAPKTVAP